MSAAVLCTAAGQIPADREALLNGEGAGMALYAELNGYPGPKHVIDLEKRLELNAEQRKQVRDIYDEMLIRARQLGKMVVKVEEELNYAFSSGMISAESVEEDAEQAGRLRGLLRGVHLTAHLRTKELLTKKQIQLYVKIRKEMREMEQKQKEKEGGETPHEGHQPPDSKQ